MESAISKIIELVAMFFAGFLIGCVMMGYEVLRRINDDRD